MRVLSVGNMYPPHHLGGYELMWRSSVRDLRARGHEVRIITTDYKNPETGDDAPEDEDVHRELRWYWCDHAWPRLSVGDRLRLERENLAVFERHVARLEPDVIAWWAMGGMSMSLLERGRRMGIPGIGVVVDDWLLYAPKEDQWHRLVSRSGPLRAIVERVTGVPARLDVEDALEWLFVSSTLAERARDGGWRVPHAAVAHAGIAQSLFVEYPPHPWRSELLYVGRLDSRKGVHTAIRALPRLDGIALRVIGGGNAGYERELHELVADLDLDDRVSFERRERGDLPRAYANADVALFPVTWEEPFGLVPLEAMAVGTPVVATGTGGSGEYLEDGRNCLLFERENENALASAILRLRDDETLRAKLREGGLETVRGRDESGFNQAVAEALERAVSR